MSKAIKDLQGYQVRIGNLVVLAYKNNIAAGQVKEIGDGVIGVKITKIYNEDLPPDLVWVESGNVYLQ